MTLFATQGEPAWVAKTSVFKRKKEQEQVSVNLRASFPHGAKPKEAVVGGTRTGTGQGAARVQSKETHDHDQQVVASKRTHVCWLGLAGCCGGGVCVRAGKRCN